MSLFFFFWLSNDAVKTETTWSPTASKKRCKKKSYWNRTIFHFFFISEREGVFYCDVFRRVKFSFCVNCITIGSGCRLTKVNKDEKYRQYSAYYYIIYMWQQDWEEIKWIEHVKNIQLDMKIYCVTYHTYIHTCPWCNGYRRRKWTRRHEFKSWTRLIAFHIALIPLGKVWIQLFSLQLWVNSRTD